MMSARGLIAILVPTSFGSAFLWLGKGKKVSQKDPLFETTIRLLQHRDT